MHVERHIGDLDEIVEVVAQLHCRIPECRLSFVLIDPEVHCGSDEFLAHADSFLAPVAEIYPSRGDVFHLSGDFLGVLATVIGIPTDSMNFRRVWPMSISCC